jgi:hypothetical protein
MLTQPRGDMSGWDEFDENDFRVAPNTALKLSGGYYVEQDAVKNREGSESGEYSWDNPIRNIWQSNKAEDYNPKDDANYGYGALYSDPSLRRGVQDISSEYGIPGRWVADSLALTTRGTFDPHYSQGGEASGLLAKTPEQIADLGVSPYRYAIGETDAQIEAVKAQLEKTPRDVLSSGVENFFTALLDPELAQRTLESPRHALQLNNGVYTLKDMWDALGSHQDIAYKHSLNSIRENRMGHVHDEFTPFCATCQALKLSRSKIIPHEGYYGD